MCKFSNIKPGDDKVDLHIEQARGGGTCPGCGHCFETVVPAKYKGHKDRNGQKFHLFAYLEQRVCPSCNTNLKGYQEPCNG
jgi:hypothetical protein